MAELSFDGHSIVVWDLGFGTWIFIWSFDSHSMVIQLLFECGAWDLGLACPLQAGNLGLEI
jgi:hypothetical protein